jgi:hypothetical protein
LFPLTLAFPCLSCLSPRCKAQVGALLTAPPPPHLPCLVPPSHIFSLLPPNRSAKLPFPLVPHLFSHRLLLSFLASRTEYALTLTLTLTQPPYSPPRLPSSPASRTECTVNLYALPLILIKLPCPPPPLSVTLLASYHRLRIALFSSITVRASPPGNTFSSQSCTTHSHTVLCRHVFLYVESSQMFLSLFSSCHISFCFLAAKAIKRPHPHTAR